MSESDEATLPATLALIAEMERAKALSELEAFYLGRNCRRAIGQPDPRALFRERRELIDRTPNFPGRGTTTIVTQTAMVAASWSDRKTYGIPMDQWHLGRLIELLTDHWLHDVAFRLRSAADRVAGTVYLTISNLSADTGLSVKQIGAPRLRVTPTPMDLVTMMVNMSTVCEECGAIDIDFPDGDDPEGPAVCAGCGHVFGSRRAVLDLAHYVANLAGIPTLR